MKTIRTNKMPFRLLMLVVGAYIMGLGVALSIRSALGTTPVSSVPYVLSLAVPGLSVGTFTILMNVLFVFAQWLILREGFGKRHLLQIPAVVLYGLFTDLNLWLLSGCLPDHYPYKLLLALLSCAVMAVGVFLTVRSEVTCMPAEGITLAISWTAKRPFGKVKTGFDSALTATAVLLSFSCLGRLAAVREGTLLSALLVGNILAVIQRNTAFVDLMLAETDTEPVTVAVPRGHFVLTIAREYGSGGHEIGRRIAEQLGLPLYDSELIALTAEKSGFTSEYVAEHEQRLTTNLFDKLYRDNYAYVNEEDPPEDILFMVQTQVIRDLAGRGSCVIVGRAANYILKGHPGLFSIFVHADKAFRQDRVTRDYGIPEEQALKVMEQRDKERAYYSKHYTGRLWADAMNYDLVLASDKYGIDPSVDLVMSALQQWGENSLAGRTETRK